ncbi:hypothetical protein LV92_01956 [Arenibacter echinorum]|uniref:Uncharacterized protein n=1 Tax=Arenibacter echinorum TaxID=440515 RepID=A0A327R750_9FLAO|nr:hypothetical protein LV92_01956 [Arenibacter echinorum]
MLFWKNENQISARTIGFLNQLAIKVSKTLETKKSLVFWIKALLREHYMKMKNLLLLYYVAKVV